jgi:Suppressor of fused protein (SUFU).
MTQELAGEERQNRNYQLRDAFWETIGQVDNEVLSFLINPAFLGEPAWPDLRQAYKRIAAGNSVIIATDGLSDESRDSAEPNNGLNVELYVELNDPEYLKMTLQELKNTWAFQLLYQAALNAADTGAFKPTADKYGVFSMELYDVDAPDDFRSDEARVGVLIGVPSTKVPAQIELSAAKVSVLSVTLLTLNELKYLVKNGAKGRMEIVEKLKQRGIHNVSSIKRRSAV